MRTAAFAVVLCLAALGACRPTHTAPAGSQGAVYRRAWLPGMMGSEAVREGRGALFDDRRVELVERPPSHWSLAFGRLGDAPSQVDLPALDGCEYPNLAYVAGSLVYACMPPGYPKSEARFFLSSSTGGALSELPSLRYPPLGGAPAVFALSPRGEILIANACAPGTPCPSHAIVRGEPQILVRETDGRLERATLADSELRDVFAVRVTPGGHIYALADSNGMLFVAVSSDHGRSFVRRELPEIVEVRQQYNPDPNSSRAHVTLHAEDGGVVVVLAAVNPNGWARYVSHDFGQHFEARRVPIAADAIDLADRRGFAYRDEEYAAAWETNDAGATWHPVRLPARDPKSSMHWSDLVACGEAGCLFDASLVRLGWDLPSPARGSLR